MRTPLEDPAYEPLYPPPPDGTIPDVIRKWGARSQVRWFRRYADVLGPRPSRAWDDWFCTSTEHRGLCCPSCDDDDIGAEFGVCCCYALREDPQ